MAKKLILRFPWRDTPIGGSFFVPTLTPKDVIGAGLRASIGTGTVPDTPQTGMQDGKFGVLFRRKR
jgi:hypothetical protein